MIFSSSTTNDFCNTKNQNFSLMFGIEFIMDVIMKRRTRINERNKKTQICLLFLFKFHYYNSIFYLMKCEMNECST